MSQFAALTYPGTTLTTPTFTVPVAQESAKMTWFATNTAAQYTATTPSIITVDAYIWDDTEAFSDWQLANVKTKANDIAVSEFAKYTDGYAMRVEVNLPSTVLFANNKELGFCLHADGEGSTCFIYTMTTTGGNRAITPRSFWLNEGEMAYSRQAGISTGFYAQATAGTRQTMIDADVVPGFHGTWSCPAIIDMLTPSKFACGRYMPKPSTSAGGNSGINFRFAPDLKGTFTAPAYTAHIYHGNQNNYMNSIQEPVTLKNASALAVTATLALATATLF